MQEPVQYHPTFYIGSPITEEFNSVDEADVAVDMSAYAPFTWQIRKTSSGPLLLELTLDETDLATGILLGSATVAQTSTMPHKMLYHDLLDASGQKWFVGIVSFKQNFSRI